MLDDRTNLDALIGRGNARARLKELAGALLDAQAVERQAAEQAIALTDRQLYNMARIYAQAAALVPVTGGPAVPGLTLSATQPAVLKENALDYLDRALKKLPEAKRPPFWRNQVHADPAFTALRSTGRYLQLTLRYAGGGS